MAQLKPYKGGSFYLWEYLPSAVAAIIFAILFALATGLIVWRIAKTRTWFSIAFAIGGLCKSLNLPSSFPVMILSLFYFSVLATHICAPSVEVIGYAGRVISRSRTDQLGPYIMQNIMLLVAPALLAASIYMTLGRVMRSVHGERHSIVPVRWLTKAFVAGDVFSFLVQSSGGGLMATKNGNSMKTGQNIIIVGLFIQIVMFGLFAATAAVFHVRMRRWPSGASASASSPAPSSLPGMIGGNGNLSWQQTMTMLYTVSALILVRSVFRVVEYIAGRDGYPLQHEWTLYVFDAVLMLATMLVYGRWYPGQLSGPAPARDWDTELTAEDSSGTMAKDGTEQRRLRGHYRMMGAEEAGEVQQNRMKQQQQQQLHR